MSGRGTAGGVVFQATVGAVAAGLILTENPLSRIASAMPGRPRKVLFETLAAVDDVLIETDIGEVYVQAKRTISLSTSDESELASVADQFVRQYRTGIIESGIRRNLEPSRDRLVLAVGDESPSTVTSDLREILDRCRTGAATALPQNLVNALETFSYQIVHAWSKATGSPMSAPERAALLDVCSVAVVSDNLRQIVEESLRHIVAFPGDEATFFDLLENWAATACQSGTGGDAKAIRLAMVGKIRLVEPPSFKQDGMRLKAYSSNVHARLSRFTAIPAPEGVITIKRPVASAVAAAAQKGSLLITGDPGAGKSAVIHRVAEELNAIAPVILLTVEATATTPDALRTEIGLEHSLLEVLEQIQGDRPAYLILDALDAVRGGAAESIYKRLVDDVVALPGWHVVASVRSFDLRLGKDWRRLFAGNPPNSEHSDPSLPTVRHIHIGLLDEGESTDLASQSPSLSGAIGAGGSKMAALASNPFNLALLADLLTGGLPATALASVSSRGELLERYWQERISDLGLPATASLKSVIELMMDQRSIDIPETSIPVTAAGTVDNLQRVGVLVTETNRRLGFRHHVLFDYAVARLALLPDKEQALSRLGRERGAGLLIAPSLSYWIEGLKKGSSRSQFWSLVARLVTAPTIDPIARVEVARVAAESVTAEEDLVPLLAVLDKPDPTIAKSLDHLVGALLTKLPPYTIPCSAWARLLGGLVSPIREQLGPMRALTSKLLDAAVDANVLNDLGIASRTLFDATVSDETLINWLAPYVVPFVARTYQTNPSASRERLETIFSPKRFQNFGHIEVPWLAREIVSLAKYDGDFAIQLFYRVFRGGEFRSDQVTSITKSWILGLTSNAAQDFAMAAHSLATEFPKVIRSHPDVGVRAMGVTLRAVREKSHPADDTHELLSLPIGADVAEFDEDYSYTWAWNADESQHDDYAKIYQGFLEWVSEVGDTPTLGVVPGLVLGETGIALAWRALFDAGARAPMALGSLLWRSASAPVALGSSNTRKSAIGLLAATYPTISQSERELAEKTWLQMDFSKFKDPEAARTHILGTLFSCIGDQHLATMEAQDFLTRAKVDGSTFDNEKAFKVKVRRGAGQHWLEHEGIDIEAPDVSPLVQLSTALNAALDSARKEKQSIAIDAVWAAVTALDAASQQVSSPIDALIDQEISDALAAGLAFSLEKSIVPTMELHSTIQRLMQLSSHPDPQPETDTETNFASSPSWGSPSPRIAAAHGLASLVRVNGLWPLIKDRFEELLLNDSHPAVRLQVAQAITLLDGIDTEAMWSLISKVVSKEKNAGIVTHFSSRLASIRGLDDARLEPIIIDLAERFISPKRGDDAVAFMITYFAIGKELAASLGKLHEWINNYVAEETRLLDVITDLRDYMSMGFMDGDKTQIAMRDRCNELISTIIVKIEPAVCSWPMHGGDPTDEETAAFKIFDEIGDQLYFAVGHEPQLPPFLRSIDVRRAFLETYAPLISKITTLGSPNAVYQFMELIGKLADADPERCFDLFTEAVLRTTGVAKYEYEPMGAARFVELVGQYLADYRCIFENEVRRGKLVDCLVLFVEAGWPEARRLFQTLPDLIQ